MIYLRASRGPECQVTLVYVGLICQQEGVFRADRLQARLKAVFPAVNLECNVNLPFYLCCGGRRGRGFSEEKKKRDGEEQREAKRDTLNYTDSHTDKLREAETERKKNDS